MDSKFSKGRLRRFCCVPQIKDIEEIRQFLKTHLQKYKGEPLINVVRNVGLYYM